MLKLKKKQKKVVDLANDKSVHTIILIGSVGTGKTDVAAHIGISICYQFEKTYWTVFRQNISTAKKSVIPSYENMLFLMNLDEGVDYKFNRQDYVIEMLHNKSKIIFSEADFTKDRQGRKIKGINATGNHIDEADELEEIMFTTAIHRRGRRNVNGQPSISIVTMNPNDTYLRDKYYDKWQAGELPKGIEVVEFTLEDSWQTKKDIDAMMSNPKPWKERYLFNNWKYSDDSDSLFKYRFFDSAIKKELTEVDINALRTIGYDVARGGKDRSVAAIWYGRTLVDIVIVKDKDEEVFTDKQALELIRIANQNGVVFENIAVDAVGVGVGVVDHARSKGIEFKEFVSGSKAVQSVEEKNSGIPSRYADLRSQVIYEFSLGLERAEIKIYHGCPFRNELISEAMVHQHEYNNKRLKVESKEEIKKRTGSVSPDILDAVVMGLYPQLDIDIVNDEDRILF